MRPQRGHEGVGQEPVMADLVTRWAVAVLGSERTDMPPGYVFNTGGWTTSSCGGLSYNLGSIDFFNYDPTPQALTGAASSKTIAPAANVYISPRAASPDPRPGAWTCLRA